MADTADIAIAIDRKLHMAFWLAYLNLALTLSKDQGQAPFDCEYLWNGVR